MNNKIIFFDSTIVGNKKIEKEKTIQKGKKEKKMEYVERYYN